MNFINFKSWPIRVKLIVILAIAVTIPFIAFLGISLAGASTINQENVKDFVSETNRLRQERIAEEFQEAIYAIEDFFINRTTFQAIDAPLTIRNTRGTAPELNELEDVLNTALLTELVNASEGAIRAAWVLTPTGNLVTGVAGDEQGLPFNPQNRNENDSETFLIGQELAQQDNTDRTLVVTTRDGQISFELIHVVRTSETQTLNGFLVAQLDIETVILQHLSPQSGRLPTYSFLIVPALAELIAQPDVLQNRLASLQFETVGIQRALARETSNVEVYITGPDDNRREVIGHYAPIVVDNNRFSVLTELNTSIISEQVISYGSTIIFVLFIGTSLIVLVLGLALSQLIADPLGKLREAILGAGRGDYNIPLPDPTRGDEVGALSRAVDDMRRQINDTLDDMRTRLHLRDRDVRLTQVISRTAAEERDLQKLMNQVVNLITENFDAIYHAQIFLIDARREYAVLRASTGELGQRLLARGHKLEVGSVSVIGQVTEQGQRLVARDTVASNVHRRNEFLPDTRAELAVPLRLGDDIIGALDVQSMQREIFDEELIETMQMLADQITVIIANARLYEETQRLLTDIEQQRTEETRRVWSNYLSAERRQALVHQAGVDTAYDFSALKRAAFDSGKSVVGQVTDRETVPFVVPVKLRNQMLGVIEYEVPQADFRYEKILLAEELVDRLAISLDNARLFQQSQRATERERLVNDISARITGQTDIQEILQTAIREVSQALRTPDVGIRLLANNGNGNGNGASANGHLNGSDHEPSEQA